MKKITLAIALLLPALILVFCTASTSKNNTEVNVTKSESNGAKNVAVLELFTSQGCSSCPSADRLLGKYANAENVIALSFHVDYWNRLGWKDPFSSAAFSRRQNEYANVFGLSGVYTPQVVINGEKEMVGSDADKIAGIVKKEQDKPVSSVVSIDHINTDNNTVTFDYILKGIEKNTITNIALVQNQTSTSIKAGENEGVNLTNYNVVRNFKTINSINEGNNSATLDIPQGINKKDLSLVVYLQNSNDHKIFSGAKSAL